MGPTNAASRLSSSLVLVRWPGQSRPSSGGADRTLLRTLARTDALVFGGLLISDDGTQNGAVVVTASSYRGAAEAAVPAFELVGAHVRLVLDTTPSVRNGGSELSPL